MIANKDTIINSIGIGILTGLILLVLISISCCAVPKNGSNGTGCTVYRDSNGASISCSDGTYAKLDDGEKGDKGEQGPPGIPGANGTEVTVVQLCPGTTTYPSVFVEVAYCINNNLYAVYSANNGFLTYLPPGNYSSNAIGSSCNLTVSSNCVVTN